MKKSIIIISSLLMVALVAGNVLAWGPGNGRGMMGPGFNRGHQGYGGQGMWNDLSQSQRDGLSTLRQAFIDETYEVRAAKFEKQQEMRMLMETSNPDRAKLNKLSREITDLQRQLRDKYIDFQLNAKKIAPELSMGQGFGGGRVRWSGIGGRMGFHGQGDGCYYNN
ncbi:MAG: periplasmic heavy metal sensor [Deltaproteobacteria bacterium]|nr:periplasmic heavy metal sensor [Deltaproteobacteria bacterium]